MQEYHGMKKHLEEPYDKAFYSDSMDGSSRSAAIVLALLYEHYKPRSVIDVGCGQGAWLAAAESLGSQTLKGLDGEWIRQEVLLSKNIEFSPINLDVAMPELDRKYDLCISLEVAEHLSVEKARPFIDFLCKTSDVVLFSAAIKYQDGRNHVNEQWQSYWIDLFKNNGYECLDIFRPHVWNNSLVEWWYRQNLFVFVDPGHPPFSIDILRGLEKTVWDVAHPVNYERKVVRSESRLAKVQSYRRLVEDPSFRFCLECIRRWFWNRVRKVRQRKL